MKKSRLRTLAFTLIELLVGMAVFALIMTLLFQVFSGTTDIWKNTAGKVGSFQGARAAFETISRNLSQATLQVYLGYADANGAPVPLFNPSFKMPTGMNRNQIPTQYVRSSDLHFIAGPAAEILSAAGVTGISASGQCVFFQAPLGFVYDDAYKAYDGLLTTCGYYLEYLNTAELQPSFVASTRGNRSCLVEVLQPAENNAIYDSTNAMSSSAPIAESTYDLLWLRKTMASKKNRHVVAENIILFLVLPKLAPIDEKQRNGGVADGTFLAPRFTYDSRAWEGGYSGNAKIAPYTRNQLPPLVEIVMVALDERSGTRLAERFGGQSPLAALGMGGAFNDPSKIHGASGDLAALETRLQSEGLNYRIFRSDIQIDGARWSDD